MEKVPNSKDSSQNKLHRISEKADSIRASNRYNPQQLQQARALWRHQAGSCYEEEIQEMPGRREFRRSKSDKTDSAEIRQKSIKWRNTKLCSSNSNSESKEQIRQNIGEIDRNWRENKAEGAGNKAADGQKQRRRHLQKRGVRQADAVFEATGPPGVRAVQAVQKDEDRHESLAEYAY
jgi:hypothetical protein